MKKLILVLLAIIIVLSVYFLLKNKRQNSVNTNAKSISSIENPVTHESNSKDQKEQTSTSIRNERSKKPEDIFSDSKTGKRIIKVLELIRYLDSPATEKGKEAWDNIQKLRENPTESFNEIVHGVPRLSSDNETKRQFLIQFASNLDVGKDDKLDFLDKELKDSIVYADKNDNVQTLVTPSIIFETYFKVSADMDMTEKLLTDVLTNASPQMQKSLISSYNRINPKKADELIKQYGIKSN